MTYDVGEAGISTGPSSTSMPNVFSFKLQDRQGRNHRFTLGMLLIFDSMHMMVLTFYVKESGMLFDGLLCICHYIFCSMSFSGVGMQ